MRPDVIRGKGRTYGVVAAVLLSAALVGFLGGTRRDRAKAHGYQPDEPSGTRGVSAASYRELRERRPGPNAEVYLASRARLQASLPSPTDDVAPRTVESRALALAQRRERRAFDGAPPTIPHAIDERTQPNCMVCHEQGARIGDRVAPQLSHRYLASCTQCHVPGPVSGMSSPPGLPFARAAGGQGTFVESDFEPLAFGGLGSRAWEKAPPVMPHPEHMRERCESCHGVSGRFGLRTPHPERQSCRQCHVADAAFGPTSFFTATER